MNKSPTLMRSVEKSQPGGISPLSSTRVISSGKLSGKPRSVTDQPLVKERAELPPLTMDSLLQVGNVKVKAGILNLVTSQKHVLLSAGIQGKKCIVVKL